MSDASARLTWTGEKLRFDVATPTGQRLRLDSARETGPSPPEALIIALAGCTAIDIVDIAQKMRVPIDGLDVEVEGDRAAESPRRFTSIRIAYRVRGVGPADHDKVRRALALSEEKYCSVRHSLRTDIALSSTVEFV